MTAESLEKPDAAPSFPISRATLFMAGLIPVSAMLMLPGFTFCVHKWNVHFFTTGAVVFLAAACLCFVPDRLAAIWKALPVYVRAAWGLLFLIGLYHVLRRMGTYQLKDVGICFLYTVVPLFAVAFRQELLKLLPGLFTLCWLLNLGSTFVEKQFIDGIPAGIPSNLNWNASFTLMTAAGCLFLIFTRIRRKWLRFSAAALVILPTLVVEWFCSSRALIPATFCALLVFLWSKMKTPRAKTLFRLAVILLLVLAALGVFAFLKSEKGKEYLRDDDRVFLAATVPDMILRAPVLGYGAPSFEQEYLPWKNAGFFQLVHTTDRVDHPHNDMLYTAAGYGITGLICWLILCSAPLIGLIRGKTETAEPFSKLLFYLFLILLIHAQLDLIFFHLPLNIFAMLILGLLWGALHPPADEGRPAWLSFPGARLLPAAAGAALLFCGVFVAAAHLTASHLLWLGENELNRNHEVTPAALEYFMMITKVPQAPPHALSRAAARSFADGVFRPQVILSAFETFRKTPVPDYGHMNLLEARALEEAGRPFESEQYYLRENELFPLAVLPLMHLARVYLKTGQREKFFESQRAIREIMDRKGIDERDLPFIIEHPEYDMRPWDIPGKRRKDGRAVPAGP